MDKVELQPEMKSCRMGIPTEKPCIKSCKLARVKRANSEEYQCLAIDKFMNIMNNQKKDIEVSVSAFYSAPKEVISEFVNKNPSNIKLLKYFFHLGNTRQNVERANYLPDDVLFSHIKTSWELFCKHRNSSEGNIENYQSFLEIATNHFIQYIRKEKISSLLSLSTNKEIFGLLEYIAEMEYIEPPDENIQSEENSLLALLGIIEELSENVKKSDDTLQKFLNDQLHYPFLKELNLNDLTDLERIEKLNQIVDVSIHGTYDSELKNLIKLLKRYNREILNHDLIPLSEREFLDYLMTGNIHNLNQTLEYIKLTPLMDIIDLISIYESSVVFKDNLIYICWLFRYEECIHAILNHEMFSNELLIEIIYYNYGHWILNGNDAEDYFSSFTLFISPEKSKQILIETEMIKADLNFALFLFSNLDEKNLDEFFVELNDLETTVEMFCRIFMMLGDKKMEHLFLKNPHLYSYFMNKMKDFKNKEEVINFLTKYEKTLMQIDKIFVLSDEIIERFQHTNEIPEPNTYSDRLFGILNELIKIDNIGLGIKIFENKGVFLHREERDLVQKIVDNPYLKSHIMEKMIPMDEEHSKESNSDFLLELMLEVNQNLAPKLVEK